MLAYRKSVLCLLLCILSTVSFLSMAMASDRDQSEIVGADISWVQQQEQEGMHFSDNGKQKDIFAILHDHGFNWVRLRVFYDPRTPNGYSAQGYCDLDHTLVMAKRAKAADMKLLLDLHYSDTWADPSHQTKPVAWTHLKYKELRKQVYYYTWDVMKALKKQGTTPAIVQIGNEITGGILWPDGKVWEAKHEETFCDLLKVASAAIRKASPSTRIMLHTATGGRNGECRALFDLVTRHHVSFDIIGVSYYPRYEGNVDNLRQNLTDLATRYDKDLIVAEYMASEQKAIRRILKALPEKKGLGAFLWEPTKWPTNYPALFDEKGCTRRVINDFGPLK